MRAHDPPLPEQAREAALPRFVEPALATLVDRPPEGDAWLSEMKFDGYRILARKDKGHVTLRSRNDNDWTARFASIARAVAEVPAERAYLDGEVAVVRPDGTTSFQALQNLAGGGALAGALVYFVFDVLHTDGFDLAKAPLEARKAVLERLLGRLPAGSALRYSAHVVGRAAAFFDQAAKHRLEGIVCKRRDAPYTSGRTRDWLKVKCVVRQEFVVGGFTEPEASRKGLGGLILGVYEPEGGLRFVGVVGTGFTQAMLTDLRKKLDAIERPTTPFVNPIVARGAPRFVEPRLVAEVAFTEWTEDDHLRHPSFQGLRADKDARTIVRERPVEAPGAPGRPAFWDRRRPTRSGEPSVAPRTRGAAGEEVAVVAGVRITHPERIVFPELGVTKLAVAHFDEAIAPRLLPHLVDRPTTLVRCPEGVDGPCFYQKHRGYWAPDAIRRVRIQEKTKVGEYLVVDDVAALVGLAQIGILEIHTWNSRASRLEQPDRLVFDLDPGEGVGWEAIVAAAVRVRDELEALGLTSFVKTTGGAGLHVVAPLTPALGWDACVAFAHAVGARLAKADPRAFTTRMGKSRRVGKIYLDTLRNVRGATSVAAYSTRARGRAPLSLPVTWKELEASAAPIVVGMLDLPARLAAHRADPWARYPDTRQKISKRALRAVGVA